MSQKLGQHFLSDGNLLRYWADLIAPVADEPMVEIGPGAGYLTEYLLPQAEKLHVIELDESLLAPLKARCQSLGELIVHQKDALDCDYSEFAQGPHTLRVVGNLPYQISSPLLFHLIDQRYWLQDMHFLLQKEVVERLAASVNTPAYSRLSVMVQYYCEVNALRTVPPEVFMPPPRVMSQFVRMRPYQEPIRKAKDDRAFAAVVKQAFSKRRKTLRNSLKGLLSVSQISRAGIDPQNRPQMLTVSDYIMLADMYTGQPE